MYVIQYRETEDYHWDHDGDAQEYPGLPLALEEINTQIALGDRNFLNVRLLMEVELTFKPQVTLKEEAPAPEPIKPRMR